MTALQQPEGSPEAPRQKWWLPAEPETPEEPEEYPDDLLDESTEPATGTSDASSALVAVESDEHYLIAKKNLWLYVDLRDASQEIQPEALRLLKPRDARRFAALPVAFIEEENEVVIAVSDPNDMTLTGQIRPLLEHTARFAYANPQLLRERIEMCYSALDESDAVLKRKSQERDRVERADGGGDIGVVASSEESANVALLELLLEHALSDKASDLHIEPTEAGFEVRMRVDGKLQVIRQYQRSRLEGLINLIKVRSDMRTDNSMVPDSGVMRFMPPGGDKAIDIRVETVPTAWDGQGCVMRLQSEIWRDIDTLGFSEENMRKFKLALAQSFGLLLVTGPTGSGKSTTLYSALRSKISPEDKIITLENPVEFKVSKGIKQIPINTEQGMDFPSGLRSILRLDPDIILVGEIRDRATAETAVEAAMTGHLLLSTLHTNTAIGALPRLSRMGIEPLLLADNTLCIVGQRLIRRLCEHCKVAKTFTPEELAGFGFTVEGPLDLFDPNVLGCKECRKGFAGRVPIHEVLLISNRLAEAIADGANAYQLERIAKEDGFTTMKDDGFEKAQLGITCMSEVAASTRQDLR